MLDFMATADEEQNFECKMPELRGKMSVSAGHGVAPGGVLCLWCPAFPPAYFMLSGAGRNRDKGGKEKKAQLLK